MRFFIFFLLLFLCFAKTSDLLAELRNERPLQLATLFCEKKDKFGKCTYFDEDPGTELRDATVSVVGDRRCSGIVIQLKRGNETCETPLLLTAGHCADPEKIEDHPLRFWNHKIDGEVEVSELKNLQKQCVKFGDYLEEQNCLLTPSPQHHLKYSGVDQALIPIKNALKDLPSVKIDFNSLLNKGELNECLRKENEATMVSYLIKSYHFDKIGKPELKTDKHKDYIKAHTCKDLRWLAYSDATTRQSIGHRCPALHGMSGSLIKLACKTQNKEKITLLVNQGVEGIVEDDELRERLRSGESILPSEYQGRDDLINNATYIEPRLLELYAKEYCGFPNPSG